MTRQTGESADHLDELYFGQTDPAEGEAPAAGEVEELTDLGLLEDDDEEVKGGTTLGTGSGGGPVFNHNETMAEDDEATQFADLSVAAEQEDQVRAGASGGTIVPIKIRRPGK